MFCKSVLTLTRFTSLLYRCQLEVILPTVLQDLNAQDQDEDPMNKLKGQKIVSCRICKGDHWTTRCPYKDTLGPMQKELAEQLGLSTGEKEKAAGMTTSCHVKHILEVDCYFVFNKTNFILISRARACPTSPKQDWEVRSPQLAGRWYAQRRVHAA